MSVTAPSATAFSCAARDPGIAHGGDWVVLEGVVESNSPLGARIRVERVYQSLTDRTITVFPARWAASSYGYPWTFYLKPGLFSYDDPDCGGSHPGAFTAREREVFGEGRTPDPDEFLLGTVGNGVAVAVAFVLLLLGRAIGRQRAGRFASSATSLEARPPERRPGARRSGG
jgi:hypothetical protein